MRAAMLLGAVALIGACSDSAEAPVAERNAQQAETDAGTDPGAGAAAGQGGAANGFSPLTGAVSGLNTRVTEFGTVIDLPSDALFEFGQASLTPAAEAELRKAAELIRSSPPGAIQIVGHTDSKGDDASNQALSEARARTVADWFGQQVGVRTRTFAVSGKGETAPIAPNENASGQDDPAGRAKNRRVEVVVPTGVR